jgi:hypothetical protein
MEYGAVVNEAWRLTRRFRSLWVLGFFAGGAAGSSTSWRNAGTDQRTNFPTTTTPEMERFTAALTAWVTEHIQAIVIVALIVLLLVFIGIVISLIAQGGLTYAGADAERGGTPTLGAAWSAGLRFFWRNLGLGLLIVLAAIAVGIVAAIFFGIGVVGAGAGEPRSAVFALLGVVAALAAIVVGVVLISTFAFAQRALVINDLGPTEALGAGWRLFRANIGTSIVLWILNIVLAIVGGIAIAIVLVIGLIPVAIIGAILYASAGAVTAGLIVWIVVGGLALLALVFVGGAILGTFLWHFWTIAYLRLSAAPVPAAPVPA